MFNNNNTYFLGYCAVPSEVLDITQLKQFKTLWDAFVDEIKVAKYSGLNDKLIATYNFSEDFDNEFFNTIIYNEKEKVEKDGKIFVLVLPDISHLGWSDKKRKERYSKLIKEMHIIVLDNTNFSTYTINNEDLVSLNDTQKRNEMIEKFVNSSKANIPEKNAILLTYKFRIAFWKFQNYTISINHAIASLKISKPTFLRLVKEYMTSEETQQLYNEEFQVLLPDFEEKPPRGVTLDDDVILILKACQRRMSDDWDFEKVSTIASGLNLPLVYIPQDYLRFKHNYLTGRSQQYICADKYRDNEEINKMIEEYFQEKDL